jgi:hypothetical protein
MWMQGVDGEHDTAVKNALDDRAELCRDHSEEPATRCPGRPLRPCHPGS